MKQKLLNKLWLRVGMIVAIMTTALSGTAWAADETVTWAATSGGLGTGIGSGTISTGTYSWNYTRTLSSGTSYTGWGSNCIQLGKNGGVEHLTLSTSAIPGTIKSVSVECASYQGKHNVSITVGGNTYLAPTATSSWTTVGTKTGTGTSSGEIVISFTGGTRALYIKSISVTYDDGGSTPQVISYDKNSVEVTYGEESSVEWPVLSNPGNVEVIYESSNENVATVNATGAVTLIKPGTTTITATDGDNDASFDITYNKAAHGLSYETKSYTVKPGSSFATPTLTNPHNLTVTYTSSDTDVATVNATTGAVEILLVGTTTIRATFAGNDYYNAGYTTYTINVSNKDFNAAGSWIKVTDASELVEGQKYLIGNVDGTALMGGQTANNRSAVSVTPSEGIITITDEAVEPIILEGETGAWYLESSVGYLYAASSSSNYLRSETQQDDNAKAKITVTNTDATIQFQGTNTRNLLRYNSNSSCFACYSSGQAAVALYKEYVTSSVATPTFSVASGTYTETQNVTISCETSGATIYYTTDGSTPSSANGTQGTSVTISETTTLKAIAIKDGESSAVATAEYTINLPLTTIAQVKAQENDTEVTVNLIDAQVVHVDGDHMYVRDASGAIEFYQSGLSLVTGDIFDVRIEGTYTLYNGNPEMTSITATGLNKKSNSTVVATAIDAADAADYVCDLVKFTNVQITESDSKYYIGDTGIQLYDKFKVGYTPATGQDADVSGVIMVYQKNNTGTKTIEVCPRVAEDIVYLETSEAVSISSSLGYSTYCSDDNLDFTAVDAIKVFYATVEGSTLRFTRIYKVAAGTGVLLVSAAGGAVAETHVPFFTDAADADAVTGNVFVRGTGVAVTYADTDQNYILFNGADGIGFYKANNNTVATNRAYIHVNGNGVKGFVINLEDDATGISLMEDGRSQMEDGVIYNLAGQRISKMQKGINIVNGKKILK